MRHIPQFLRFILIEILALFWGLFLVNVITPNLGFAVVGAGGLAALLAWFTQDGRWWVPIHLGFWPLISVALTYAISPTWYLLAFILSFLLFSPSLSSRVPLYFSGRKALQELEKLLPDQAVFLDIGAGTGTVLRWLNKHRPDLNLAGIELALLPWLCGRFFLPQKIHWLHGDYSYLDLTRYDVVYAFLSPEPMSALWEKARQEMRPGSLLISNSFSIPGVDPDAEIPLHDWKKGKLLIWRM